MVSHAASLIQVFMGAVQPLVVSVAQAIIAVI